MAASTGNVVFRVDASSTNLMESAGNDSNIWDDTALIKAYDKAISSLKGASGQSADEKRQTKSNKQPKKKKKKRKNKWKVGDHCQAVFSEDGHLYDAIIKSINYKTATCWVTYSGYGNEEEHHIADLLAAVHIDSASAQENDFEDAMDYSEFSPHNAGSDRPSSRGSQHHQSRSTFPGWFPPPPFPPHHHMPPVLPGAPGLSLVPPAWGMTPYQTPQFPQHIMPAGFPFVQMPHGANTSMGVPAMPPPPAPDKDDADDSGIHSMLMSWYMSGYHTGYYQGLRQGKRLSTPNTTEPKQERHAPKPDPEQNDLSVASDSNNTEDDTR